MAIFVLKRISERLFADSRAEIIKKISAKEHNVASHLLMYMTVDLSSNKDEKIAHWSDKEIPTFTVKSAQLFNPDRWKMMDFTYLFPTFLGSSPLDHNRGAVHEALVKMSEECNNKEVWKFLLTEDYKNTLKDYVKRLNILTKKLRRVPEKEEIKV